MSEDSVDLVLESDFTPLTSPGSGAVGETKADEVHSRCLHSPEVLISSHALLLLLLLSIGSA
jgi:hypothetical protein